jgi:hypothetical protein
MTRFFSIGKNQTTTIATLAVLVLLGASYFFVYVPNNEKTVQARHFRCLQNIDGNIHEKIKTSIATINGLLEAANKDSIGVRNYIRHLPDDNFRLLPITDTITPKSNVDSLVEAVADLKQFKLSLFRKINPSAVKETTKKAKKPTVKNVTEYHVMGIQYDIRQFIKPLLPTNVFDHYVVFYNVHEDDKGKTVGTNKVIFESFPSGLSYLKKDSLLQAKNGIVVPGMRSLTLGGTDYKVFTQAINIDATSEFIIAGLVADKNYQKEKNQLPALLVLLLVTVAFGMLILLPWIKLYHMGSKDKLAVADGIASVLVSMLIISLLFFLVFRYAQYLTFNSNERAGSFASNNRLATQIRQSFNNEIDSACGVLSAYDAIRQNRFHGDTNNIMRLARGSGCLPHVNTPGTFKNNPLDTSFLSRKMPKNIAVKEVFWLDGNGAELCNWDTASYNAPHLKFNNRNYFIHTKKNELNGSGASGFYIDQLVSRTRNVFTSIIAKSSLVKGTSVVAMTFRAKSLDSVVMPEGYQFAIIDNEGKVRYHSIMERNLNENLKTEFADSDKLVSCLEARSDTTFKTEYYGRQYNVTIKPFDNLPYFIVVLEDLEFRDAGDTEPYVFNLSMLFCIITFIALEFTVTFFISSPRSFFKKQFFDTSWVAPNRKSQHQYELATLANTLIIALLIVFFRFNSFLGYFYTLLFSINLVGAFLTGIFALKYKKNNDPRRTLKYRALICFCVFIILIDWAAFCTLDSKTFWILTSHELLLIAGCSIVCKYAVRILSARKYLPRRLPKWTYVNSFSLMLITRLIVTSGLPVMFFFIYSYNFEQKIDTRYRHLNFATTLSQKAALHFSRSQLKGFLDEASLNANGIYPDGKFICKIEDTTAYPKASQANPHTDSLGYTKEQYNTVKVLGAFRLLLNNIEVQSNNINSPSAATSVYFSKITTDQAGPQSTTKTYFKLDSLKYLKISSADTNYTLKKWLFCELVLLALGLIVFYMIILNIIKKLFALNLPLKVGWQKMDEELILDQELNRLLLIVGPPGSGKLSKLKQRINDGKMLCTKNTGYGDQRIDTGSADLRVIKEEEVFIADMILISAENGEDDPVWKKHKKHALKNHSLVIINHFEYNIKDFRANRIKLNFLESLMQQGECKIIIISTVHPLTFLDSFMEQQNSPAATQQQGGQAQVDLKNIQMPESELERWHVLLGHFRIIIEPLENILIDYKTRKATDKITLDILEETQYSHYLNKMRPAVLDTLRSTVPDDGDYAKSDSLIFKLQITAHYFYNYIWQSLTKEEKFLLYDLAEDGLVNPYDDYNLCMLLSKGIIVNRNGRLALFNKGFRNFILTAIGISEVNRIKKQVKDNGKWGNLKTPISIAILAILGFLIASQHEAYTRVIAYITALGAGFPAVMQLFNMFGNSSKQKTG